METSLELFPNSEAQSARITMSGSHTVINGAHIQISNGFMHKKEKPASVVTKDILSVGTQKLRDKRFLVAGLICFGILLLMNSGLLSQLDTVAGIAERGLLAAVLSPLTVMLLLPSAILVGWYVVKPITVLRIKAMGGDFAVNVKGYSDEKVRSFIEGYYKHFS